MKFTIFGLMLFLAACNGSTEVVQKVPYSDPALVAKVAALTQALAAATHADAQRFSSLVLIGKLKGVVATDIKMQGEFRTSAISPAATFGGCSDMGIYSGQGGSDSANPLASQFEIYRQTPTATCPGATTSYNETTGLHDRLIFAAWDQPNCKGNMYVETDVPQNSMSLNALEGILVMMSPDPSDNRVYASPIGATPQPISIQSSMNGSPNGRICSSDIETRQAILMAQNDVQVSGVPDSLVPGSWSKVAP